MAIDKKLRFGVEGGDEVTTYMQRFHKFAEQQARDIADYARTSEKTGAGALKNIEDQISAIEKRNKLEEQYRKSQIKVGATSGEVADPTKALSEAAKVTEEDKLSVQILKDILETEKQALREQVKQERENDAESAQKDKEQGAELKRKQKASDEEETNKRYTQRGMVQAGAGVGLSQNQFYGMASLLAFIPIFGQALSSGATKALGAASSYQESLGANVGMSGGSQDRFLNFGNNMDKYGYNMSQSLREREAISRSRGSAYGAGGAALNSLILQRGAGLDQSTILGLERLQRGGANVSTRENVQSLVSGLKSTGAIKGQDLSVLPEYLQLLTTLGQEQINTLGKIDMGVNQKLVVGLSTLDESFKNPDVLRNVVEMVKGGLSTSKSPQMEAMSFAVLSKLYPEKSFVELQEAKEVPTIEYFNAIQEQLKSMSANNDQYILNTQAFYGGKTGMARKIAEGEYGEANFDGEGITGLNKRAESATSELAKSSAAFTQTFEKTGNDLTVAIKDLNGEVINLTTEVVNQIKDGELKEAANTLHMRTLRFAIENLAVKIGLMGK